MKYIMYPRLGDFKIAEFLKCNKKLLYERTTNISDLLRYIETSNSYAQIIIHWECYNIIKKRKRKQKM